jgi:CSLREA domain-containing protein
MKRSICTILMVALLVLPAASLGVAQEGPPPAPEGWRAPPEDRSVAPPEGRDLEGWAPPPSPTGPGAVITVTTTDDELNNDGDCSLREAIQAANTNAAVDACTPGNGADTVLLPAGTYLITIPGAGENGNQTGDLDVLDHVTLTGDGMGLTILDGNNLDRVLHMWTGLTVEINALTVTHGRVVDSGGGGIFNRGTLTLNDVALRENTVVSSSGGGLANNAWTVDSSATLNGCLVDGNEAEGVGGGISSASGPARTSELTLNDSTVSNNTATVGAGGLYAGYFAGSQNATSTMVVLNSTVEGNTASKAGGIFAVGSPADNAVTTLTVDHSTIRYNTIVATGDYTGNGGGVFAARSETTIVDSTIHHNEAFCDGYDYCGGAAGLFLVEGTATVERTTIRNNIATANGTGTYIGVGGGLELVDGTATVRNSTVSGNQATHDSGGILVQGDAFYTALSTQFC